MQIQKLTWQHILQRVDEVYHNHLFIKNPVAIYGVPRGGAVVAALLTGYKGVILADCPQNADVIVDDIIDSGRTREKFKAMYGKPFIALYGKGDCWLQFPWEKDAADDIAETVVRQLEYIGEDATREGLVDTPARVVRSWEKLYGGYAQNPADILKTTFTQKSDEVVLLKNIEFYSTCEHHMLPFFGKCHIAYLPNEKVVGISKLARLMECFSRRLQIQERVVNQIADAMVEHLDPKGAAVIVEAQHFCMTSRGVEKQNSVMVTSALRGVFLENPTARKELLDLIRG